MLSYKKKMKDHKASHLHFIFRTPHREITTLIRTLMVRFILLNIKLSSGRKLNIYIRKWHHHYPSKHCSLLMILKLLRVSNKISTTSSLLRLSMQISHWEYISVSVYVHSASFVLEQEEHFCWLRALLLLLSIKRSQFSMRISARY